VTLADPAPLADILCIEEERVVARDNTSAHEGRRLQLPQSPVRAHYVKARVKVPEYAGRPWCQRELSLFRRPRLEGHSVRGRRALVHYPSLVVEAMQAGKSSTGVPEFGNSALIRRADDVPNLEELIVYNCHP
jgi:hypothetical protein